MLSPRAAPLGSGWFLTINPCNHDITIHKSQGKMHFTLRFMVYIIMVWLVVMFVDLKAPHVHM